jgi:hypothetical protein
MRRPGDFRRDRCAKVLSLYCNNGLRQSHRHYAAKLVVTMRAMPQPTRTFRWLAQVTPPRDELLDPSSSWIAQRGPSSRPRPRDQCKAAPKRRPSEPWVNGSSRWTGFQQESAIDAKNGCSRGRQQKTLHESGVVSRVPCRSRHAQRSGRTETLTGQAAHTSSKASEKEDSEGENQREGTGNSSTRDPDRRRKRPGRREVPAVSALLTGHRTDAEPDYRTKAQETLSRRLS